MVDCSHNGHQFCRSPLSRMTNWNKLIFSVRVGNNTIGSPDQFYCQRWDWRWVIIDFSMDETRVKAMNSIWAIIWQIDSVFISSSLFFSCFNKFTFVSFQLNANFYSFLLAFDVSNSKTDEILNDCLNIAPDYLPFPSYTAQFNLSISSPAYSLTCFSTPDKFSKSIYFRHIFRCDDNNHLTWAQILCHQHSHSLYCTIRETLGNNNN